MSWWQLAYIDDKDHCLQLWKDMGMEDPWSHHDYNPKREIPISTIDVKLMSDIRTSFDKGMDVECFVPDDMNIVTQSRSSDH
jgi:hypothetical protein